MLLGIPNDARSKNWVGQIEFGPVELKQLVLGCKELDRHYLVLERALCTKHYRALIVTYTTLVVPDYNYGIVGPKTL